MNTEQILRDGIEFGRYHSEQEQHDRFTRKHAAAIVAIRYETYGIQGTEDMTRAVHLYMDGFAIGKNGWNL